MSDSAEKDWPEFADRQNRIFIKLVLDLLKALEQHNQYSLSSPPAADRRPSGLARMKGFHD
jgi:hypothetical protein